MVENPEWLISKLVDYSANVVSAHYEACAYSRRILKIIHKPNMKQDWHSTGTLPANRNFVLLNEAPFWKEMVEEHSRSSEIFKEQDDQPGQWLIKLK